MLKQSLQQKLLQKLSPQQIQLMKLLQVPTASLEERIKEELEANPALDEGGDLANSSSDDEFASDQDAYDDVYSEISEAEKDFDYSQYIDDDETPYYKTQVNNYSADDEECETPISTVTSFHERLEAQLGMRILSPDDTVIAKVLIGNIDDSGYLRRELDAIVDDLIFSFNISATTDDLERLLEVIHDFEPAGIGARDLQECLLIQIKRKERTVATLTAEEILKNYFDEFTKKHYDKITNKLEIEEEDLKDAIDEILKLNPKPGNSMSESIKVIEQIVPDFSIHIDDDNNIEVKLNGRNAPELRVNRKYNEMFEDYMNMKGKPNKSQREAILFVKQKIDSAKWFIDAILQRQNTLLLVMNTIVDKQREYFLTGDETKLKPMILKDIADVINMDISTVSRVTNSKYAQTPYGTFLLKTFFSESLSTDSGEDVSTREVKKILEDLISNENKKKPLTDQQLMDELNSKGYNIARRTVAKYREQLNLPVARLRKEL